MSSCVSQIEREGRQRERLAVAVSELLFSLTDSQRVRVLMRFTSQELIDFGVAEGAEGAAMAKVAESLRGALSVPRSPQDGPEPPQSLPGVRETPWLRYTGPLAPAVQW